MKILSRYLLKEHAGPFAFALGALTGLLVVNQLVRQFASLIGKGLPWSVIGGVFGLSMPFILAMTLPMAVLVAVLQTFSRLGADSEITALKASGVSLLRFVRPVLLTAGVIALGEFVFVDQVLPRANHRLKNLLVDIARKKPTFELVEQSINEIPGPGSLYLRAGRIDQATDRMKDVVIYDLGNTSRRRTIYADSGYIRSNADQTDLFLTLFDGYIHDYDRAQADGFRRIFFKTDLVRVQGVNNRLERTGVNDFRGDREMSLCEMEAVVLGDMTSAAGSQADVRAAMERDALALVGVVAPRGDTARPKPARRTLTALYCALLGRLHQGLLTAEARADTVRHSRAQPAAQLPIPPARRPVVAPDPQGAQLRNMRIALESQRQSALSHAATFQVEIHKKYSLAVSCIVFVLIGAPVALRFPRGGIGLVIGASVVIFGFYYIGLIGGETLADHRFISPFLAMWGPNLLMTGTGLWLFLRLGREQTTARGGGFRVRRRRRRAAARAA